MNTRPDIHTRTEMENLIGDVICLHLRLDARRSEMEREIAEVRQRHTADLDTLERELSDKRARVHLWAEDNRDVFRGKKSLDCHHGVIGFRSGPPKLERIKEQMSWEEIAEKLGRLSWGSTYLRTPPSQPEVNKEALLADRQKLNAAKLQKAGLRIVQEERFYIAPRTRVAENLLRAAA